MKETLEGQGAQHQYWHAAWIVEGKTCNLYMGSCMQMSSEEAPDR
jgi:hypothetical protein